MAAIYSNGGNRWNILGFNFTKRNALSSVYKISMRFSSFPYETPGKCEFMGDIDHATLRFERRYPNKDVVKK